MMAPGSRALFRSSADLGPHGPVISGYHLHTCEIVRALTVPEELDEDSAPMFRVRFDDGHEDDAFADELEPLR